MAELLKEYEHHIESIEIVPSRGGRFEVSLEGDLIYSKLATGRHAEPGEVLRLLRGKLDIPQGPAAADGN